MSWSENILIFNFLPLFKALHYIWAQWHFMLRLKILPSKHFILKTFPCRSIVGLNTFAKHLYLLIIFEHAAKPWHLVLFFLTPPVPQLPKLNKQSVRFSESCVTQEEGKWKHSREGKWKYPKMENESIQKRESENIQKMESESNDSDRWKVKVKKR